MANSISFGQILERHVDIDLFASARPEQVLL